MVSVGGPLANTLGTLNPLRYRSYVYDQETGLYYLQSRYYNPTIGRFINGFIAMRLSDHTMIRMGLGIIGAGMALLLIPGGEITALIGLVVIGLGCAPIYPCIIHSTPDHFGAENSQALIGVQMASAYMGNLLMPPLFGLIANHISTSLLPWYEGAILVLMIAMCEALNRKSKH